jgi:hypothetical protein
MGIKRDSSVRLGLMIGDLEFGEEYLRGWVVVSAQVEGVKAKSSMEHSVFATGSSIYSWTVCIVLTNEVLFQRHTKIPSHSVMSRVPAMLHGGLDKACDSH